MIETGSEAPDFDLEVSSTQRGSRAAWAMWDGGDFTFHRTEYDVERVVAAADGFGGMSDVLVHRYRYGSD